MSGIRPETKVLWCDHLKPPAEVTDVFNASKREMERIWKLFTKTGDVHDKHRSGRPHKTNAWEDNWMSQHVKARYWSNDGYEENRMPAKSNLKKNCFLVPTTILLSRNQYKRKMALTGENWRLFFQENHQLSSVYAPKSWLLAYLENHHIFGSYMWLNPVRGCQGDL